jgi:hypothetical protein
MSADLRAVGAQSRADATDSYLRSSRALPACTRELDHLAAGVAARATAAAAELGATVEVRRSPGRCIVQFGGVALTLSWVRDRVDTVADGCLLVNEWDGIVARGIVPSPERAPVRGGRTATLLRERLFVADATQEKDWRWREEKGGGMHSSDDLAAQCVDSLVAGWRAKSS